MKIRFVARKFTLTDDAKERVQKKLQKLDKFFSSDTEAAVALYGEKIGERIEVTIYHGGTIFRAEESDKDIACALDKALDVIERQIRKNRTRLEKKIHITGSDVNHIKNVLRMRQGETILISAGDNLEYTCLVSEMEAEEVIADISYVQEVGMELPSKIYLFQGLPKSDKMEMIIQKAVELGVYEVIPVSTARAVVKLDAKKEASKQKRWQTIAESAAKQSKRMVIPEIHSVMKFSEAVNYAEELDIRFIPYELAENMAHTKKLFEQIEPGQSIGIFIGPEGGFTPEEIELAMNQQVQPITLGKRILRTETAGMTVLSILMFLLEGKE